MEKTKHKPYIKKAIRMIKEVIININGTKLDDAPLVIRGRLERDGDSTSLYIENDNEVSNSIFSLLREACLDAIGGYSEFMCPSFEARVIPDDGEFQLHIKLVEEYKEIKLSK
jgi:hypothetical protein